MTTPSPCRKAPAKPEGQRSTGFTLVEILLATVMGTMLMIGMARATQLFVLEMSYVADETDTAPEEALLKMSERVRDAWYVEVPSASQLRVFDPYGNATEFVLNGSTLDVTRPSGATGAFLTDVASANFAVDTVRRLRDLSPADVWGPWYSKTPTAGTPVEIVFTENDAIAIGFHMSSVAPASAGTVQDIVEERLQATLGQITLTLSFLDGSLMEFCHLHATNPHDPAHPGYVGGKLSVDLHEARAPDDGRPYGPSLASMEVPASELPPTSFHWWDWSVNEQVYPPDSPSGQFGADKCKDANGDGVCDHPANNPHHNPLDAPDGVAWGWWTLHPDTNLIINPSSVPVAIDLSALGVAIEPGRAYTLVLTVAGWDEVRIQALPPTSAFSGVAMDVGGAGFAPMLLDFPMMLEGTQTCTQTEAHDVVSRVTMTVNMADGRSVSSSASVFGQTSVADEWRGVVPGQWESLDL